MATQVNLALLPPEQNVNAKVIGQMASLLQDNAPWSPLTSDAQTDQTNAHVRKAKPQRRWPVSPRDPVVLSDRGTAHSKLKFVDFLVDDHRFRMLHLPDSLLETKPQASKPSYQIANPRGKVAVCWYVLGGLDTHESLVVLVERNRQPVQTTAQRSVRFNSFQGGLRSSHLTLAN